MAQNAAHLIDQFRLFVDKAEHLLPPETKSSKASKSIEPAKLNDTPKPSSSPLPEFQCFIEKATPLVVANIKSLLPLIAGRAAIAKRWLVDHDLLAIAGLSFIEDAYTELMAWALHPATHPESAQRRQLAWLKAVGLEGIGKPNACTPKTQMITEDGIPDLVLQFEQTTVVLEAKTGSAEHNTPSGQPQTIAYPKSVRGKLNLSPEHKIEVVFITPDRRPAENPQAKATTFIEFVFALSTVLDREKLAHDTRIAYAMLFTHFLTYATETDASARELINEIWDWSQHPDWADDKQVLERMPRLLEAMELLLPE